MKENSLDNRKLLSICTMGRNDDYTHDFIYRITTTLNYIGRNLSQLGRLDDVEFVITDWGSQVPLAESLSLSPEAAQISRFVYVPIASVRQVQKDSEGFHLSLAANTSIRRARGEFVLLGQADVLITRHTLDSLLKVLESGVGPAVQLNETLFLCPRYHIPWQFVERQPGLEDWDRYLLMNTSELNYTEESVLNLGCGAGGLLMHRNLWERARGFDERYGGWGFQDIDLSVRVTENHSWLGLSTFGINFYHMGHAPVGRRVTAVQPQNQNPHYYNRNVTINNEEWGLGSHDLPEQHAYPSRHDGRTCVPRSIAVTYDEKEIRTASINRQLADSATHNRIHGATRLCLTPIRRDEIEGLFFLDWYSVNYSPRIYLEFGFLEGVGAAVVASSSPGVEIYGFDDWEGIPSGKRNPWSVARTLRDRVGHRAMTRFLNGPIMTAVERLRQSFIGNFSPDLVFVRGDLLGENLSGQVVDLLKYISPNGAIVITCADAALLNTLWKVWRTQCEKAAFFLSLSGNAGMILFDDALSLDEPDATTQICNFDVASIVKETTPPAPRGKCLRIFKTFASSARYRDFATRILNRYARR